MAVMAYLICKFLHILSFALLCMTILDALLRLNERARHQPVFARDIDRYTEQAARRSAVRAIMYLTGSLLTGILLVSFGAGWSRALHDPVLGLKVLLWVALAGVLHAEYLGAGRQSRMLVEEVGAGDLASDGFLRRLAGLRARRRTLLSVALFLTMTLLVLGMQVHAAMPAAVTAVLLVLAGLFSIRARSSTMSRGWF